jgi:hypothetical protein
MLVGVCDFLGSYAFPPAGLGVSNGLWAATIGRVLSFFTEIVLL